MDVFLKVKLNLKQKGPGRHLTISTYKNTLIYLRLKV